VVDNGAEAASEALVEEKAEEFAARGVRLTYVRNGQNSLTSARNIGSRLAHGDIVFFIDDDTLLHPHYVEEILKVYEAIPDAMGVQGYIYLQKKGRLGNILSRFFFLSRLARGECRVLPSISTLYPSMPDRVMACQYLSGVSSYRRSVLEEFLFDEKLLKYSDGEDVDFSSRVWKKFPGSLFLTPFARYSNVASPEGRAQPRERVYMREIYGLYLFFKLFDPTLKNIAIFLWSRVGYFVLAMCRTVLRRSPAGLSELCYLLGAYWLCLRHLREIRRGDLDFFNRTIR
jgi:GT2 family glycosyltransferase